MIKMYEIKTPDDFLKLGIVDFNKLGSYWENKTDAVNCISSWVSPGGMSGFSVMEYTPEDWKMYERDDFPIWRKKNISPKKKEMAKNYWDWFMTYQYKYKKELAFYSNPDFCGTLDNTKFYGNIGKISPVDFSIAIKGLEKHDLWITLLNDGGKQIIMEALYSLSELKFKQLK